MLSDKFVKGDVVLNPSSNPIFPHGFALKMYHPGIWKKNDSMPHAPCPHAQVCFFEEKEKSFIKAF